MSAQQFDFGMIGLGVMGRNFLLNMADHGFKVIGFDKDNQKTSALESAATAGTTVKGVGTVAGHGEPAGCSPKDHDACARR